MMSHDFFPNKMKQKVVFDVAAHHLQHVQRILSSLKILHPFLPLFATTSYKNLLKE